MSVTNGHRTIAEFKLVGVSGRQGVGFHRLLFSLEAQISAMSEEPARIEEPRTFVCAGPSYSDQHPLGLAVPETKWVAETFQHFQQNNFLMLLDLSGEQLSALERLRGGNALHFRLDLHTLVESRQFGRQRGFEQIRIEVPASSWAKVLRDFGYAEILLVALELPVCGVPQALQTTIAQFREAHDDFVAGRYDRTVSTCRLVIDAVAAGIDSTEQAEDVFKAYGSRRREMTKRERALLVTGAVRHYTHLGHHFAPGGQLEPFSRQDAQFILAATSSVIWDSVAELRLRSRQ